MIFIRELLLVEEMKDYHFIIPKGFSLFKRLVDYLSNSRCFRKTRRNRIDELKVEVLEAVSTEKGHEDWVRTKGLSTAAENLSKVLGRKYHSKKWYDLLSVALVELRNEGYHELLGVSAATKRINQPMEIVVGSPPNQ